MGTIAVSMTYKPFSRHGFLEDLAGLVQLLLKLVEDCQLDLGGGKFSLSFEVIRLSFLEVRKNLSGLLVGMFCLGKLVEDPAIVP